MKPLKDHTVFYDDECPLCNAYTKAFVKTGMLESNGREPFTQMERSANSNVDWDRARNEIAMINKADNTVKYGLDSLIAILSYDRPVFMKLLRFQPLYNFLQKLYFFISFNRKVIAPGRIFEGKNTCTPDMNYKYRWAYILFAWLITSTVLLFYSRFLIPMVPKTNFLREFVICGGQIAFQGCFLVLIHKDRTIHYLGNMMTISLGGAMLLAPALLLKIWIHQPYFYLGYFMLVVGIMFFEHMRRIKILELPWFLTGTWVLYRMLVLLIIL